MIETEELPPVLAADGPPGEFEPGRSTEAAIVEKHYGDVERAFREAHAVVELVLDIGRHSGAPIETRGAIAIYDASRDILEMYGAAKVPHWNRDNIAHMLGRAPSSVLSRARSPAGSRKGLEARCWRSSPMTIEANR